MSVKTAQSEYQILCGTYAIIVCESLITVTDRHSASKIDAMVLDILKRYLNAIKKTPKDKALEIRYRKELSEKRRIKKELTDTKNRLQKRLTELSIEVGKSLSSENKFPVDVLSMSINSTKDEMAEADKQLYECDAALDEQIDVLNKLDFYYEQLITWADEFETASREQQKMIICQLIDAIKIGRGYNIEIEFNASYKQFFSDELYIEQQITNQ